MNAEHIYIGDEIADLAKEPTNVERTDRVANRVNGICTELTYYEEGYLAVRETRKKDVVKEHMIELRFLADKPIVKKRLALPWLWSALVAGALSLGTSYALPMTAFASLTITATAALATLATLSLLLFVYRSDETHRFVTASGHATVIRLTGSFGCLRRVRRISRQVRSAIAAASGGYDLRDVRYLRAEMKAHYKLAETGVISRKACSDGTSAILSRFG